MIWADERRWETPLPDRGSREREKGAGERIGEKHDSGKDPLHLLPPGPLRSVARVLGFGARKYGPWKWMHVENARDRYYAAALRHLFAWFEGEEHDPESGESHLAHAVCCLLFLIWFEVKS